MSNYEYLGCVTGFSQNGITQLIQPTQTPMAVAIDATDYTERLEGVGLLVGNKGDSSSSDIACIPTATKMLKYTGFDALPLPDTSAGTYARYRLNGGDWVDYIGGTGHITDEVNLFLESINHPSSFEFEDFNAASDEGAPYVSKFIAINTPLIDMIGSGFTFGTVTTADGVDVLDMGVPIAFMFNGYDELLSAGAPSVNDNAYQVAAQGATTIEFITSASTGVDLVAAAFGDSVTISACGYGIWDGF